MSYSQKTYSQWPHSLESRDAEKRKLKNWTISKTHSCVYPRRTRTWRSGSHTHTHLEVRDTHTHTHTHTHTRTWRSGCVCGCPKRSNQSPAVVLRCVPTCTNQCVCVCVYLCVLRVLPCDNRATVLRSHLHKPVCVCVCVSVCVYLCVLRVLPYENRANRFLAHKGLCLCQVSMVNKISCTVNICNTTQL